MKTPEELFAALGNRGEYAALPHVTLDEVRMIYEEGQSWSHKEIAHLRSLVPTTAQAMVYGSLLMKYKALLVEREQQRAVIQKLRLAINEAIAISGTGTPQDWVAAQEGLCRVLEEVKAMLGEAA